MKRSDFGIVDCSPPQKPEKPKIQLVGGGNTTAIAVVVIISIIGGILTALWVIYKSGYIPPIS